MNKSQRELSLDNIARYDDEVSLIDLVAFVKRNLFILISGAILGCILGLGVAYAVAPQWEATALLRIGQLGNAGNAGNAIEPTLQVVDRIKNRSFQNDVLKNLGLSTSENDKLAKKFRDTLKVKLEKSDLVNLAIRGSSPETAKQNMSAIINEIESIHNKMLEPTVHRWQQELASIHLELDQANAKQERLEKSLNGQTGSFNDKNFSQAALLSNILLAREAEFKNLRDRKRMLEEQLSPARTFSTKVIGRVEVSEDPAYPKKPLFAALGLFFGLLIALFWSVLQSSIKNK